MALGALQQLAVHANVIVRGVGLAAQRGHHLPVHHHAAGNNHLLGMTPAGDTGLRENLLQPLEVCRRPRLDRRLHRIAAVASFIPVSFIRRLPLPPAQLQEWLPKHLPQYRRETLRVPHLPTAPHRPGRPGLRRCSRRRSDAQPAPRSRSRPRPVPCAFSLSLRSSSFWRRAFSVFDARFAAGAATASAFVFLVFTTAGALLAPAFLVLAAGFLPELVRFIRPERHVSSSAPPISISSYRSWGNLGFYLFNRRRHSRRGLGWLIRLTSPAALSRVPQWSPHPARCLVLRLRSRPFPGSYPG